MHSDHLTMPSTLRGMFFPLTEDHRLTGRQTLISCLINFLKLWLLDHNQKAIVNGVILMLFGVHGSLDSTEWGLFMHQQTSIGRK